MQERQKADQSRGQYRRWTAAEITYLKRAYKLIGDKELAERMSTQITTDGKVYKLKQIEKKRGYLNLHRTPDQLAAIRERNRKAGCWSLTHWRRWVDQQPIGTVAVWQTDPHRRTAYIKTETGYQKLAHHNYEKAHGAIPKGMLIRHTDGNPLNCEVENLECITKAENATRNAFTDKRIAWEMAATNPELKAELLKYPALLDLKRTLKTLNTKIRNHGKQ